MWFFIRIFWILLWYPELHMLVTKYSVPSLPQEYSQNSTCYREISVCICLHTKFWNWQYTCTWFDEIVFHLRLTAGWHLECNWHFILLNARFYFYFIFSDQAENRNHVAECVHFIDTMCLSERKCRNHRRITWTFSLKSSNISEIFMRKSQDQYKIQRKYLWLQMALIA